MPTKVFYNLDEEKKQRIFEAAKKEFSNACYENVSIKKITEHAKIARASFYAYFEDKEDLLLFILKKIKQDMLNKHLSDTTNTEKNIILYIKKEMIKKINYVKDFSLEDNKFFPNIKLFKNLSYSKEGRVFLLKYLNIYDINQQIANNAFPISKFSKINLKDRAYLVEILTNISKTIFEKLISKQITKDQAIKELDRKFQFLEFGINNIYK